MSRPYNPEIGPNGKVYDLQAEALENSREFREMIFRQLDELGEVTCRHAEEQIRFLAQRRRERNITT